MLVKTFGFAVHGINATKVAVEVNIATGVNFFIVGLPDSAVKESQQRVRAALNNHGYKVPGKTITVNMAPADIRKEGSAYDLTIAIGILGASEQINAENIDKYAIMGELSLDGEIRPIRGCLPIAIKAKQEGFKGIILPVQNGREAAVVEGLDVYCAENIKQVIDFFNKGEGLEKVKVDLAETFLNRLSDVAFDFADVKESKNIKYICIN